MTISPSEDTNTDKPQDIGTKVKSLMDSDDGQRFLPHQDYHVPERRGSSFATFARKFSTIVMGEDEGDALKRRRRSRRSPNVGGQGNRDGSKQRKSLSPLQPGHKIHLDLSKGGLVLVERKTSFMENICYLAFKRLRAFFGYDTEDNEDTDCETEEVEVIDPMKRLQELCAPHRHRPASLESLVQETGFNKEQVKSMYRGFKSECPSGILTEQCFYYAYLSFFPGRDETYTDYNCSYTHYIFSLLDKSCNGFITFDDFIRNLSIMVHGSDDDKFNWIFDLYDLNGDGYITREEMEDVVYSIYHLVDPFSSTEATNFCVSSRVAQTFQAIDPEHDGIISREKWLNYCNHSDKMSLSLLNNNSYWSDLANANNCAVRVK